MPRTLATAEFYHVYNRGVRKQPIFETDKDYVRFFKRVQDLQVEHPVSIFAYCLMPNHFHFLIRQNADEAITRLFSRLCNSHAKYFNIKYELVGPLFQGRFKAKLVDRDHYLLHLIRYIHLNPAELAKSSQRTQKIEFLERYAWSSYRDYLEPERSGLARAQEAYQSLFRFKSPAAFRAFTLEGLGKQPTKISHLLLD